MWRVKKHVVNFPLIVNLICKHLATFLLSFLQIEKVIQLQQVSDSEGEHCIVVHLQACVTSLAFVKGTSSWCVVYTAGLYV